jgi:hypothetical protein
MKRISLRIGILFALILVVAIAWSQTAAAGDGLVRTTWPSAEDPGLPFYARVELLPPFVFNDGEWAAIIFYRDPGCVPANFNLISVFDIPAAFFCPLNVQGASLWHGEVFAGAPKIITTSGTGAVPIWFVPWDAVKHQARPDGVLTIADLEQIEGRLVGYADQYAETLHPHSDPAFGGGGHQNPKMIVNAQGPLEDGRQFNLHITWVKDEIQSTQIQFR